MAKFQQMKKTQLFKRTLPYIKKERKMFWFTIFLCVAISVLSALTPFITRNILDDLLPKGKYKEIIISLVIYGVIIIVLSLSRYFFQYINTLTGMRIEKRVREEAIKKIDYLKVDYYSLEPDGKIVAKITSDSAGVRTFYVTSFTIFNALLNILIVYIGLLIMQPLVAVLFLLVVPVLVLWITLYRRCVHKLFIKTRETSSRITGKLNELITGSLIIQDFNKEDEMLEDYKDLVWNYVKCDRRARTINCVFGFELLSVIKRFTEIGLLVFLGFYTINPEGNIVFKSLTVGGSVITVGLISAFCENLDKMINPINAIFNNLNELEDSLVGATRCYMFIDEENETRILDGEEAPQDIKGHVTFDHIKFAYINDNYVLKDLSLDVEAGKKIGIVGHTGSGKSSLMNLLLAYNDYQGGHLLVDGVEITKYNKASYRKNIGIVLQTPALFAGTLKSNITMERDYSDEEVLKVIDEVGASYLLKKTGYGLDMPISFRGENLSLGEKQLISFARVLLRNPKILVLDEATANIDSETEEKIKNAMDIVAKGRTTFIIAHRLSTIKDADEIIVLNAGEIVGKGTHDELYNNCSVYKDMYDSQFRK